MSDNSELWEVISELRREVREWEECRRKAVDIQRQALMLLEAGEVKGAKALLLIDHRPLTQGEIEYGHSLAADLQRHRDVTRDARMPLP